NPVQHYLGGLIGEGLRNLVLDAYSSLAKLYEHEDEIYVLGFSRGAYAARALVGMIGASGIVRSPENAEVAWAHYRVNPPLRSKREQPSKTAAKAIRDLVELRNQGEIHADNGVKCVGVWETVGSYGVPAGFHLGFIARFIAMERLGFHDTSFGNHVGVGLHAVGIDEHRRPFVPTFWTIAKGQRPAGIVEQTWFAGEHGNVGGGEPNTGLSTQALVWMIARIQALTSLEFDLNAVAAIAKQVDVDGEVYDSTVGWPLDHLWPHFRRVLLPDAIEHGALISTTDPCMGLFESSRVTHFFHRRFLGSISPGLILTASNTMMQSGWQSDGSPLSSAVESRHNLVCGRSKDRNHDAVMRIGSEAPKRRTHSSNRHESQGTCRESATSNRHRYPITSVRTGPKLSGYPQRPPIIVPDAKRRRPLQH